MPDGTGQRRGLAEPRFACDAMLGGLARWLRAAGYDASWQEGITDQELIGRNRLSAMRSVQRFAR